MQYSSILLSNTGVKQIEIINNEVIAAGQLISNNTQAVLIHCRITPATLDFTIKSNTNDLVAQIK